MSNYYLVIEEEYHYDIKGYATLGETKKFISRDDKTYAVPAAVKEDAWWHEQYCEASDDDVLVQLTTPIGDLGYFCENGSHETHSRFKVKKLDKPLAELYDSIIDVYKKL
jgi:hypothetical protein